MKTRFVRPSDEQMINVFDKEFSNEKVSKFSLNSKVKTLILTGIRYATPECGSCQRSKLSDEECLVMTRGKIVSISQEEVNLFPTFKLNTIEQFSMLKNYLLHKYLLEDRYFDEIFSNLKVIQCLITGSQR